MQSPQGDLVITAAHCVYDRQGGGFRQDIAFVPAFRHGEIPYGIWTPTKLIVDDSWRATADPDDDVAFIVLAPNNGKSVADVLGANSISFNTGYEQRVRVTGYPQSADNAVSCVNVTSEQSPTQLRFPCQGFPGGTSGGPWIVRSSGTSLTGTIIGVIGGYQQGGDTPDISYSAYFGANIQKLYAEALSAS